MIASSFAHRMALVAAACITLVGDHRLQAQDTGLPESVRVGLARYADLDPLAVTWSETTEATLLGREKIAPKMLSAYINRNNVLQLAFRDGRMYMGRNPVSGKARVEIAFDRSVFYMGDPAKGPQDSKNKPSLIRSMPGQKPPKTSYFEDGYFRAAGIRLPRYVEELVLSWRPQSELLALLAEGGRVEATGLTELDGRKLMCVQVTAQDLSKQYPPADLAELEKQLRVMSSVAKLSEEDIQKRLASARKAQTARPPQRRFDFYFDPERGYAVRHLDTRDETGRLLTRSDCTEHEQMTDRDVWLPRRCRVEHYTFVGMEDQVFGSPLYADRYEVSAFDLKPWPDERFELKYTTPGTRVNDKTFPEVKGDFGVTYEIPANPQQLDEVIAAARGKYLAEANADKRSHTFRILFLVLNGVGLSVLVIYLVVHRRKKASSA